MPECKPQVFGYAHSHAVMAGLKAHVRGKGGIITDGYAYIDKPGEDDAFWDMIKVAKQGGQDILYIDSVKELAGRSLADFKQALTAIENAGMKVFSMAERDYDYAAFMTAIRVLEDLTPAFQKSKQFVAAITMFRMGADVQQICDDLGMKKSEVYEAIASYTQSLEELEAREQAE